MSIRLRTIALEGRCFVYSTIQGNDPPSVLIHGRSCIIDPLGNVLVEPNFGGEMSHFADVDRRIIARGKYDLDVVGHYARPDICNLTVDTRPKSPVCFTAERPGDTAFSCQPHTIAEATEGPQRC